MNRLGHIVFGATLALLIVPLTAERGTATSSRPALPVFYLSHAKEVAHILEKDENKELLARKTNPTEYGYFVRVKMLEYLEEEYRTQADHLTKVLIESANENHLDPLFLMAVIRHESKFSATAVGAHGEIGLMQIKPQTALWVLRRLKQAGPETEAEMREALFDPATNIRVGAAYFGYLRKSFRGRAGSYISAYNMGATSVRSLLKNGIVPRTYAELVMAQYREIAVAPKTIPRTVTIAGLTWTFDR